MRMPAWICPKWAAQNNIICLSAATRGLADDEKRAVSPINKALPRRRTVVVVVVVCGWWLLVGGGWWLVVG